MATKFEDTYEFPDEVEAKKAAAEEKFEIEIEDDTPPADRGRKPMKEPVEDPTDEELATYDEKVQARMKKFTRGYHDERRAKEQAVREREATETYAKQIIEENIGNGCEVFLLTWPLESVPSWAKNLKTIGINIAFGGNTYGILENAVWKNKPEDFYKLPRILPPNSNGISGRPSGRTLEELMKMYTASWE